MKASLVRPKSHRKRKCFGNKPPIAECACGPRWRMDVGLLTSAMGLQRTCAMHCCASHQAASGLKNKKPGKLPRLYLLICQYSDGFPFPAARKAERAVSKCEQRMHWHPYVVQSQSVLSQWQNRRTRAQRTFKRAEPNSCNGNHASTATQIDVSKKPIPRAANEICLRIIVPLFLHYKNASGVAVVACDDSASDGARRR